MTWYCDYAIGNPLHGHYHDNEYGFPEDDEARLFERLVLEINQAGLNWELMLRKRAGFRAAFHDYDVERVAGYRAQDRERLLADAEIIRNRLKIDAVIHNARVLVELRKSHGGFAGWLAAQHPLKKPAWVDSFRKAFKFTGVEITGEFLMSVGYLPGAHRPDCPAYRRIERLGPAWMEVGDAFYE